MDHIFHIITHLDIGGAERVAVNIASADTKKYKFHIIEVIHSSSSVQKSLENEIESKGVIYHKSTHSNTKTAILKFPFQLIKLIREFKPVIIHSHTEIPDLSLYLSHMIFKKMFKDIRIVRTIHNTQLWTKWQWIGSLVESFFIAENANVAISQSVKHSYEALYRCEIKDLIHNGVYEQKQKTFDLHNPEKINVLFSGRFEYQKGIDELIKVVKAFANSEVFDFYLIGSGSLETKVIDSVGALSNVYVYDKVYELASYLGSFDYLFMPSNFEGLALMSMEASFAKTATIINDAPGLSETLPLDWPLKVAQNNIEEYIKIFNSLSKDDALSNVAYNFARANFSVQIMQGKYLELYAANKNKL